MPSNKFKHFSVVGKSKKNYGKRVSQDGIALPHVLLAKGFTAKEVGAKRSKVYSTKIIPTFKTSELKLKNGARALDEHTIEIQAKNRADPEDPQPFVIKSGEATWIESWERPEGGEAGDTAQMHGVTATCNPKADGSGYWFSLQFKQVKVASVASPQARLKALRDLPPETFHLKRPTEGVSDTVLMDIRPSTDNEGDAGAFNIHPEDTDQYRLTNSKDGEEPSAVIFNDFGYRYIQWGVGEDPQHVYVEASLWSNHIAEAFGITNVDTWAAVGVKFAHTLNGVFIGYVNKDKTMPMPQNQEYYVKEGPEDPDFGITAKITGFVTDPLANVKRVGYEVTEEFVREKGLKGCTPVMGNAFNEDDSSPVYNMSEMPKATHPEVYAKKPRFYFVCDTEIYDDDHEVLVGLDPAQTSAVFGLGKKKGPITIRWKTGVVYAVLEAGAGDKRPRE